MTVYYYPAWTVRTYYILIREGITLIDRADMIEVADLAVQGKLGHAGLKFATELYRAAGLGVYPIYKRLNTTEGRIDLRRVRSLCEYLDNSLHARI